MIFPLPPGILPNGRLIVFRRAGLQAQGLLTRTTVHLIHLVIDLDIHALVEQEDIFVFARKPYSIVKPDIDLIALERLALPGLARTDRRQPVAQAFFLQGLAGSPPHVIQGGSGLAKHLLHTANYCTHTSRLDHQWCQREDHFAQIERGRKQKAGASLVISPGKGVHRRIGVMPAVIGSDGRSNPRKYRQAEFHIAQLTLRTALQLTALDFQGGSGRDVDLLPELAHAGHVLHVRQGQVRRPDRVNKQEPVVCATQDGIDVLHIARRVRTCAGATRQIVEQASAKQHKVGQPRPEPLQADVLNKFLITRCTR